MITPSDCRDYLENYRIETLKTLTISATTVNGSAVITTTSTTGIKPQMRISGIGIPLNAVVESVDSGTQLTMDSPATADGTGVALTITYYKELTDDWIMKKRDNFIIPLIEKRTGYKISEEEEVTELCDGNGQDTIILSRKPVSALVEVVYVGAYVDTESVIGATLFELDADSGIVKKRTGTFPKGIKNVKVTYTVGFDSTPLLLDEAVKYLLCEQIFGQIADRTGGGQLSVAGYNRSFGDRGKYTNIRNDLARAAHAILREYITGVV